MRAPYRLHFGAIYAALGIILAAAIVTTVVLVTRDKPAEPPAWSPWQPVGDADAKVEQIRSYVSDVYKLPNGDDFSVVRAGPPTEQGLPIESFVIRRAATATQQRNFNLISAKNSVVYTISMCGVTIDCTQLKGQDAANVTRALRREALELSLYTLEYVGDVPSVLVELPQLTQNGASPALLFQRSDVAAQLQRPLRFTLRRLDVVTPNTIPGAEARRIDSLTVTRLYQFSITQDPSGAPLMVLDPVQP